MTENTHGIEDRLNDQEQSLERLTAENAKERGRSRLWKRASMAGWLVVGAVVFMGQDRGTEEVVAQRFVVRDGSGTMRALLACNNNGVPSLSLMAADGETVQAAFGMTSGTGSSLVLKDADGQNRVHITVANSGTPAVSLLDGEGNVRISSGVANNGVSFIAFKDTTGKIRSMYYAGGNGEAHLRFKDADGGMIQELPE